MQPPNADCERSAELPAAASACSDTLVAIRALFTPRIWVRPPAQFFCYLVGAYLGFLAVLSLAMLLPTPRDSREEIEISFALMALLFVPATVLLSLPYAATLFTCVYTSNQLLRLPPLVPILLGLAYFPILLTSLDHLMARFGLGDDAAIWSCLAFVTFGYPIMAVVVGWHFGRVQVGQACSSKRIDETGAGAGSVTGLCKC